MAIVLEAWRRIWECFLAILYVFLNCCVLTTHSLILPRQIIPWPYNNKILCDIHLHWRYIPVDIEESLPKINLVAAQGFPPHDLCPGIVVSHMSLDIGQVEALPKRPLVGARSPNVGEDLTERRPCHRVDESVNVLNVDPHHGLHHLAQTRLWEGVGGDVAEHVVPDDGDHSLLVADIFAQSDIKFGAISKIVFYFFAGILWSASRAKFLVFRSNHVRLTQWLLYSSTPHAPEGFNKLKSGWAQEACLQWSCKNWYFLLDTSRWLKMLRFHIF